MINAQAGTFSLVLAPQSVTAGATATANIDTLGSDYATLVLSRNKITHTNANNLTVSLSQSDDTNASNFATVVSNITLSSQSSAVYAYHVDLRGKKRYLRLSQTPGTATTDAITVSAIAYLTRKEQAPGTTTQMADAGQII